METLAERIARAGPLRGKDAVGWVVRLAKRVESMHTRGTVHGRLSPACVILQDEACSSAGWLSDPITTPVLVSYRSPERAAGEGPSRRDDTWALAVTLYEALTGALPFPATSDQELRRKINAGAPPGLSSIGAPGDEALRLVLERALARDTSKRITEVAALLRALVEARPSEDLDRLPPLDEHTLLIEPPRAPPRPSSSGIGGLSSSHPPRKSSPGRESISSHPPRKSSPGRESISSHPPRRSSPEREAISSNPPASAGSAARRTPLQGLATLGLKSMGTPMPGALGSATTTPIPGAAAAPVPALDEPTTGQAPRSDAEAQSATRPARERAGATTEPSSSSPPAPPRPETPAERAAPLPFTSAAPSLGTESDRPLAAASSPRAESHRPLAAASSPRAESHRPLAAASSPRAESHRPLAAASSPGMEGPRLAPRLVSEADEEMPSALPERVALAPERAFTPVATPEGVLRPRVPVDTTPAKPSRRAGAFPGVAAALALLALAVAGAVAMWTWNHRHSVHTTPPPVPGPLARPAPALPDTEPTGAPVVSARPAAPDMGAAAPDMGAAAPDMGAAAPDTGATAPDTGATAPDMGATAPDTGATAPDMGATAPDTGAAAPDTGAAAPDAGAGATTSATPAPEASKFAACMVPLFPDGSVSVAAAAQMAPLCDEVDPMKGAAALRSHLVQKARSGGVSDAATKEWVVLGWYEMAAVAVMRARCCEAPPPLELSRVPDSCPPLDATLNDLGAAVAAASSPGDPAVTKATRRYSRAVQCIVRVGAASLYGRKGKLERDEAAAFKKVLARSVRQQR